MDYGSLTITHFIFNILGCHYNKNANMRQKVQNSVYSRISPLRGIRNSGGDQVKVCYIVVQVHNYIIIIIIIYLL